MGTPLGPKYIPYTYMDPLVLGVSVVTAVASAPNYVRGNHS